MYGIIIASVGILIGIGILYGCLSTSTTYDKYINDCAQEAFLKQHKKQYHIKE